jgi:UPF0755 protein
MIRIRSKRRFLFFVAALALLLILASFAAFNSWIAKKSKPFDPGNSEYISISIPKGTGTKAIGAILQSNSIISDSLAFSIKSKLDGYDGKYQAGDYTFSPSMSMDEIMRLLLAGYMNTTRFTIPEGYDIKRTADALESQGVIDRERFFKEVKDGSFDYWFLKESMEGENRLEGYLFPETYEIYLNASEHDIIDKMLFQFNDMFTDEHIGRMNELSKTIEEIVILASIIEREAVVSEDRPIIAGVFYNRLKVDMPLQSCATVQYILGEQKPVLSTKDTEIESPYNTYIYNGLPPTPICSPGIEAINAALWPEDTEYLFFLAKGDGSHVFSKTYEEHLTNKRKYID